MLSGLRRELLRRQHEPLFDRTIQQLSESARVLHRLFRPTGLVLRVVAADARLLMPFLQRLQSDLASAFRRCRVLENTGIGGLKNFYRWISARIATITSTLVLIPCVSCTGVHGAALKCTYDDSLSLEENVRSAVSLVLNRMASRFASRMRNGSPVVADRSGTNSTRRSPLQAG